MQGADEHSCSPWFYELMAEVWMREQQRLQQSAGAAGGQQKQKAANRANCEKQKQQKQQKQRQQQQQQQQVPTRKLRILALHGYGQDAASFREKTGAVRSAISSLADIVYLDAPFAAQPFAAAAREDDAGEAGAAATAAPVDPGKSWHTWGEDVETGLVRYTGVEAAVRAVNEAEAAAGPFDGVLGFSQGAGTAAVLCAMQRRQRSAGQQGERGGCDGDAAESSVAIEPHFRFAVLFAGFLPRDPRYQKLFDGPDPAAAAAAAVPAAAGGGAVQLPVSLHVMGETDRIITAARSRELALAFPADTAEVVLHDKGHMVPAQVARKQLKQFIKRQLAAMGPPD
jgi:predicted esterase